MKEFDDEIEYLIGKSSRRGITPRSEIAEVGAEYGETAAEALAEKLHGIGVSLVDDESLSITPRTNVLLNDLSLVELISLCLQLPMAARAPYRLYRSVLRKRCSELDLKRLDYVDCDEEWLYLAPSFNRLQRIARSVLNSGAIPFARNWQAEEKKTNLALIRSWIENPVFSSQVLPEIRRHYLGLRQVQMLTGWITATGQSWPSMTEIIQTSLHQSGIRSTRSLILSNRALSSIMMLEKHRDICYVCPPQRRCISLETTKDPCVVLKIYRSGTLEAVTGLLYPGKTLAECLLTDPLLTKFFVPYSLVVTTKRFMIDIGLLHKSTGVLPKNSGRYCPNDDRWLLASQGRSEHHADNLH